MARTTNPMNLSSILNTRTCEDDFQYDAERRGSCSSLATSSSDHDYSRFNGRSHYPTQSSFPPTPPNFSPSVSTQQPTLLLPACLPRMSGQENFEKPQLPSVYTVLAPTLNSNTSLLTRRRAASPSNVQDARSRGNRRRNSRASVITLKPPFQQLSGTSQYNYHSSASQFTHPSQTHYPYVSMQPPSPPPSPPAHTAHTAHSNKAYSIEQVHFIRYHKEDLNKKWPEVLSHYRTKWPEDFFRESTQCFSARYYRDNWLPMVDPNFNLVLDSDGKVLVVLDKVRTKFGAPTTMVEKHPEAIVKKKYGWVGDQYLSRAKQIIMDDAEAARNGQLSHWGKWRAAVLDVEARFKSSSRHVIKREEIAIWERQLNVRFLLRPADFEEKDDGGVAKKSKR